MKLGRVDVLRYRILVRRGECWILLSKIVPEEFWRKRAIPRGSSNDNALYAMGTFFL